MIVNEREKYKKSEEICDRFVKKLKDPTHLSGRQLWTLHKGDGTGDDVPVDFIEDYAKAKSIKLYDRDEFDQIFLNETEASLKSSKRVEKTKLIDISVQLKNVPATDDSFKYRFSLNTNSKEAEPQIGSLTIFDQIAITKIPIFL